MKHTKQKQIVSLSVVFSVALALLSGCAGTDNNGNSDVGEGNAVATKILVGTHASPAPYGWVEADGTVGGYDQAVIKAVDELLPEYEFELEVVDFSSIFTGVDSGRYQMGANNFSKTEEREEKYYFDEDNYIYNTMAITFQKGRTDIQSVSDLGGKSAVTENTGVTFQLFLEAYNEANPDNPVNLTYSDIDMLTNLSSVSRGEVDFYVCEVAILNYYVKEYGLDLDYIVLDPEDAYGLLNLNSYHIYPKTEEGAELRDAVSGAITQLKAEGTLSALSEEYFGFDMFANE